MTYGAWYVNGLQTGLPGGNQQSLGPFTNAFSGCQYVVEVALSSGANTITVPTTVTPNGLWIIPPSGNTATLQLPGSLYISPDSETYVAFDTTTPHIPVTIVITAGGAVDVVLQYV